MFSPPPARSPLLAMKEDLEAFPDIAILPRTLGLIGAEEPRERRALLVARAGDKRFGLFADEADGITEGFHPTPLPGAPPAVLGIVSVRGRMLTALDPLALLSEMNDRDAATTAERNAALAERSAAEAAPPRFVLALRGDEQLALAVSQVERVLEILPEEVAPLPHAGRIMRGLLQHERDVVIVLDPAHLFEAALRGQERRRQRT